MIPLETSRIYDVNLWTKISSRRATYPVISSCALVISPMCPVNSSSRQVAVSTRRLVLLSRIVAFFTCVHCLAYFSTRRVVVSTRRLVLSSFCFMSTVNSLCRPSTRRVQVLRRFFFKRGDLGTTVKQYGCREPIDELKECLRVSIEALLDRLSDRVHEDMDGVDFSWTEFRTWWKEYDAILENYGVSGRV